MASTQKAEELEKNNDDERRNWEALPVCLLEMISLHLFNDDVIRFRLTCKSWQAITFPIYSLPIPKVIESSNQLIPLLQSSASPKIPWLIFFTQQRSRGILKFFHPTTSETYVIEIPQLAGAVFRYCKNDWLLMSRESHSFFFFNPFTMSTIELADLDEKSEFCSMCFTTPPTSSDCVVFAHGPLDYDSFQIHLFKDGEWFNDFIKEDKETTPAPFMGIFCPPVLCKDIIYSLGNHGILGVYNPDKEPSWEVLRETKLPNNLYVSQGYLAECNGELVSVFVGHIGKPILVYKFDWSLSKWQELDSLGSKTMFVSESGSVWVEGKGNGTENRIYFPRFRSKEGGECRVRKDHLQTNRSRECVFYSLRTHNYHCCWSKFSCEDWIDTTGLHYDCTWINVPTHY